jgi:hypothetical protein
MDEIALIPGSLIYPTRNFATLGIAVTPRHCFTGWPGRFGSAWLSMSPWRSDHIITSRATRLAYGL